MQNKSKKSEGLTYEEWDAAVGIFVGAHEEDLATFLKGLYEKDLTPEEATEEILVYLEDDG